MTKQERIEAEKTRLFELFKNMDANQLETARGLISSAAFLRVSLEDLEKIINENGYVDEYSNGQHQTGQKISAAVQSYNGLCAKYTTIVTKLLSIVPPAERPQLKHLSDINNESVSRDARLKKEDMRQRMDRDYLDALSTGRIENDTESYKTFCNEWRRVHA